MKIVFTKLVPPGFVAINIFGVLFIHKTYEEVMDSLWCQTMLRHEAIHTAQMKEMFYIFFYIYYFFAWIIRVLMPPFKTAYYDISLEQEAYYFEDSMHYLALRKPYAWTDYIFKKFQQQL